MNTIPNKRLELTQTINSLCDSARAEQGCHHCEFYQNIENANELFLVEEWNDQENLMAHLKSKHFSVLRSAMNFLQKPYKETFYTVFHPLGMEERQSN